MTGVAQGFDGFNRKPGLGVNIRRKRCSDFRRDAPHCMGQKSETLVDPHDLRIHTRWLLDGDLSRAPILQIVSLAPIKKNTLMTISYNGLMEGKLAIQAY